MEGLIQGQREITKSPRGLDSVIIVRGLVILMINVSNLWDIRIGMMILETPLRVEGALKWLLMWLVNLNRWHKAL